MTIASIMTITFSLQICGSCWLHDVAKSVRSFLNRVYFFSLLLSFFYDFWIINFSFEDMTLLYRVFRKYVFLHRVTFDGIRWNVTNIKRILWEFFWRQNLFVYFYRNKIITMASGDIRPNVLSSHKKFNFCKQLFLIFISV